MDASTGRRVTGGSGTFCWSGKEPGNVSRRKGWALKCCSVWRPLFIFLYLVLDLNFFPKALSSSGTDKVRVKEPSDSDLTTRALREHCIKVSTEAPGLVFSLKKKKNMHTHRRECVVLKSVWKWHVLQRLKSQRQFWGFSCSETKNQNQIQVWNY